MLSEKLFEMAERIKELEAKLERFDEIKKANIEMIGEIDYLRYLLSELGVDDVYDEGLSIRRMSVFEVMALEKAIAGRMM